MHFWFLLNAKLKIFNKLQTCSDAILNDLFVLTILWSKSKEYENENAHGLISFNIPAVIDIEHKKESIESMFLYSFCSEAYCRIFNIYITADTHWYQMLAGQSDI